MGDFHPADLGLARHFNFQEFSRPAHVLSVVQHGLPVIVIAGAAEIVGPAGRNISVGLAVIGDGKFQVRDLAGKEREDAKTFNRSRQLINERVPGAAGGAIRVFLRIAAFVRLCLQSALPGLDF